MQEQLSRMFGFCTALYIGLLGYETVSRGSFDACAVKYLFTLFLLYPNLYSAIAIAYSSTAAVELYCSAHHYCMLYCCSAVS